MTQQAHSWAHTQRKPSFQKTHAPPVITAVLFTAANLEATWMSTIRGVGREDVAQMHDGILLSHEKEWNSAICRQT